MSKSPLLPPETISHHILLVRGHKVLLDTDLAILHDAPAKRFLERHPADSMFQLTEEGWAALRSQISALMPLPNIGQSKSYHQKRLSAAATNDCAKNRSLPMVFTLINQLCAVTHGDVELKSTHCVPDAVKGIEF